MTFRRCPTLPCCEPSTWSNSKLSIEPLAQSVAFYSDLQRDAALWRDCSMPLLTMGTNGLAYADARLACLRKPILLRSSAPGRRGSSPCAYLPSSCHRLGSC